MVELQVQFAHKFQVNVLIRFLRMKCNDNRNTVNLLKSHNIISSTKLVERMLAHPKGDIVLRMNGMKWICSEVVVIKTFRTRSKNLTS